MRFMNLSLIALLAFVTLAAQSKPKLSASLQLIGGNLTLGEPSLALLKIFNEGSSSVYIAQEQIQMNTEFQYQGLPYIEPGLPGGIIAAKAQKSDPSKRDIQSSIITAVEPGQFFVRLIQIRTPPKIGEAILHAYVFVPVSNIETIHQISWPYTKVVADHQVRILSSTKK